MIKVKPKLTEILKERNMTQMQLSEKSGVPQGSISRFDNNTRHEANHLFNIANALDLEIRDLFKVVED